MGAAHYQAGAWKKAVDALDVAAVLRLGGDGYDLFFLAMAHWKLGHKDQAREYYDRAVQWTEKNWADDDEHRRFRARSGRRAGD